MFKHFLRVLFKFGFWRRGRSFGVLKFAFFHPGLNLGKTTKLYVQGELYTGGYVDFGSDVSIYVEAGGKLTFGGDNYLLDGTSITVFSGESMILGKGTTVDRFCTLVGNIEIGMECIISPFVFISSHKHLYEGSVIRNIRELEVDETRSNSSIILADQVWVGYSSMILPGTNLGRRIVVGALSKVQGDFNRGFLVLNGNPATVLKKITPNHA